MSNRKKTARAKSSRKSEAAISPALFGLLFLGGLGVGWGVAAAFGSAVQTSPAVTRLYERIVTPRRLTSAASPARAKAAAPFAEVNRARSLKLGRAIGAIPSDEDLVLVLQSLVAQPSPPTHDSTLAERLERMRRDPENTFARIREAARHLTPEFEKERQFLIQFGGRLDVDPRQKVEFLTEELTRGNGEGTAFATATIAFDTLLEVVDDPDAVARAMQTMWKDGIADLPTARGFVTRYAARFPGRQSAVERLIPR